MTKIDVGRVLETGTKETDIVLAVENEKGIVQELEVENEITIVADIGVLKEIPSIKIAIITEKKNVIKTNRTNDDHHQRE